MACPPWTAVLSESGGCEGQSAREHIPFQVGVGKQDVAEGLNQGKTPGEMPVIAAGAVKTNTMVRMERICTKYWKKI